MFASGTFAQVTLAVRSLASDWFSKSLKSTVKVVASSLVNVAIPVSLSNVPVVSLAKLVSSKYRLRSMSVSAPVSSVYFNMFALIPSVVVVSLVKYPAVAWSPHPNAVSQFVLSSTTAFGIVLFTASTSKVLSSANTLPTKSPVTLPFTLPVIVLANTILFEPLPIVTVPLVSVPNSKGAAAAPIIFTPPVEPIVKSLASLNPILCTPFADCTLFVFTPPFSSTSFVVVLPLVVTV